MTARRPWARPLGPVYAAARAVKAGLRRLGVLRARTLQWPVVSIGSLSAGGAGKTPVVIALAKLLSEHGWQVDVLSRGYGRAGSRTEQVQPEVSDAARRFGDEPVLIAQRTGVSVWVGANRASAGQHAEALQHRKRHSPSGQDLKIASANENAPAIRSLHLLDDGFQHRQLARAIDIVLVTAEDLNDILLPAGNLREPPAALQRADVAVVRDDEFTAIAKRVWTLMGEGAQMWTVRRSLRFPAPLFVFGAGLRPVTFCAIARPEDFAAMLADAGCGIVETIAFADHHRYTMPDIERIIEVAASVSGSGFVTTEKDAVKLSTPMRDRLAAVGPLMIVALEAEFVDARAVIQALENKLRASEIKLRASEIKLRARERTS
jgi:tetraacyldisaccharide 4'-kinase